MVDWLLPNLYNSRMSIILERRKGILFHKRGIRLTRLLRLYEDDIPVVEIARMEKVTKARIYQLLNEAFARRENGEQGTVENVPKHDKA
jgi:hypothetical protein